MRLKALFMKCKAKSKRRPAKSRIILTYRPKATPKKTPAKFRKRSDMSKIFSISKFGGVCPERVRALEITDCTVALSSVLQKTGGRQLGARSSALERATPVSLTDHQSVHEPAPPNLWTIKWRIYASKAYVWSGQEYEHSCRTKSGEHGGNGAAVFGLIIR